jgi:hypothetical protein
MWLVVTGAPGDRDLSFHLVFADQGFILVHLPGSIQTVVHVFVNLQSFLDFGGLGGSHYRICFILEININRRMNQCQFPSVRTGINIIVIKYFITISKYIKINSKLLGAESYEA